MAKLPTIELWMVHFTQVVAYWRRGALTYGEHEHSSMPFSTAVEVPVMLEITHGPGRNISRLVPASRHDHNAWRTGDHTAVRAGLPACCMGVSRALLGSSRQGWLALGGLAAK